MKLLAIVVLSVLSLSTSGQDKLTVAFKNSDSVQQVHLKIPEAGVDCVIGPVSVLVMHVKKLPASGGYLINSEAGDFEGELDASKGFITEGKWVFVMFYSEKQRLWKARPRQYDSEFDSKIDMEGVPVVSTPNAKHLRTQ